MLLLRPLLSILLLLIISYSHAHEDIPPKWRMHLSLGHYSAQIFVPKFNPIHIGIHAGATYQWNHHPKHQFIQTAQLGYFRHRHFQKAIQLYSEIGYELHLANGLSIRPLMIGGGYVLSISDMESFEWNSSSNQYEPTAAPTRNNWVISLGTSIGYTLPVSLIARPCTLFIDYRFQVQGITIRETSPFMAYSPIRIGLSLPITH